MKKVCKNCKYFLKANSQKDMHECNNKNFIYDPWEENKDNYPLNDKIEIFDGEKCFAEFYVGSNFGCIHFDTKND